MHMQPLYRMNEIIGLDGSLRARTNAYIKGNVRKYSLDIYDRRLCLPSDINMKPEEQDKIIEVIRRCFE